MPNYTLLRRGDRLPSVGVLQKLLNRSGAKLNVDGVFGPRTHEAVLEFQRPRKLKADGIVGEETWSRLVCTSNAPILDCVDVFDEMLYFGDAQSLIQAGANPILIGGMCRGTLQAVNEIASRGQKVFLLRFIGHGAPGWQGIAVGKGGVGDQRSAIHYVNAPNIERLQLQRVFGPYGNVEMHGCRVAGGVRGRTFISTLARGIGVPVTAGTASQYSTFRFDGPTFTAFPAGRTLRGWCESLPDFEPISVP
jgi:hypothetical protein